MKTVKQLQTFKIPDCGMCGSELTEQDPYKITFKDGSVDYVCDGCGTALMGLLEIDGEKIEEIYI